MCYNPNVFSCIVKQPQLGCIKYSSFTCFNHHPLATVSAENNEHMTEQAGSRGGGVSVMLRLELLVMWDEPALTQTNSAEAK